jgi:hypothetical protein
MQSRIPKLSTVNSFMPMEQQNSLAADQDVYFTPRNLRKFKIFKNVQYLVIREKELFSASINPPATQTKCVYVFCKH